MVGDLQVSIAVGMVLCGFGKGRFKAGPAESDNDVAFKCESADQLAIMDGVCKPLCDYLGEKRKGAPDKPPLCYHTATFHPEENAWELKQVFGH